MFVGCSEISILLRNMCSLSALGDLLSFSVPGEQKKKMQGCGLVWGINTQSDNMIHAVNG